MGAENHIYRDGASLVSAKELYWRYRASCNFSTFSGRLRRGWLPSVAASTPVKKPQRRDDHKESQEEADLYALGMKSRMAGEAKGLCPICPDDMRLRHWWLAGWHDADIALTARQTGL